MFKETIMPKPEGEKESGEEKKQESKIKTDYEVIKRTEVKETKSKKWEDLDKELKDKVISLAGDEFTVKFIWLSTAFDEQETYPQMGSIKVVDKEGKTREFNIREKVDFRTRNRSWLVTEKMQGEEEDKIIRA